MWIPYDSTLVLGNTIATKKVKALQEIAQLQQTVEAAQDTHNAQLRNKLALDMSIKELQSMGLTNGRHSETVHKLMAKSEEQSRELMESLMDLVDARMDFDEQYTAMIEKQEQKTIGSEPESPIKFSESTLSDLPISSDSMKMDVQYFRRERGTQGSRSHVAQVSAHVAAKWKGVQLKVEVETQDHMHRQVENNRLVGTLVITANATHKNAKVYDPKYDAQKLVRAWNDKNEGNPIDLPAKAEEHFTEWSEEGDDDDEESKTEKDKMAILTGMTYGSSFVGFIHFLKTSHASSYEKTRKRAVAIQVEATKKNWLGRVTGKFGLDASATSDLKRLMSNNQIESHVAVMTHGIIPTIASQGVATALKEFSNFDSNETNSKLCTLASGKDAKAGSVNAKARHNIRAGQIRSIERAKIESVISGMAETDRKNNQVLNMNSLMLAFDDYVKNVEDADGGVPINFFVATLSKKDVIGEWMKEYRPQLYNQAMGGNEADFNPEEDEQSKKQN